ncbi:MAG: anthranilate synthase component I family protein [Flavobacteriaceae bacterium]|nr:anthranilate synthase component I family protein [Flavobacteriaceae bacterium]
MNRVSKIFKVDDITSFKKKLFNWSNNFEVSVYLDSNNYKSKIEDYETILCVDIHSKLPYTKEKSLDKLDNYINQTKDWIFGYFSYDLKNEIEDLKSDNIDKFDIPNIFFFQPKKIWLISKSSIEALYLDGNQIQDDWTEINSINSSLNFTNSNKIQLKERLNKEQYKDKIKKLLDHIKRGDIYEANYCMEWFSENSKIVPNEVYLRLNEISKTPMSAYFKNQNFHLLSSSPERYIKRENDRIVSQPIKGTSRRDSDDFIDMKLMKELHINPKERSENIMIVDLIRNDLSKFSIAGSVEVKELCKVYSFKQVHQMISTIESKVKHDLTCVEIIKSTFPMGSMTGAPKIRALEIIEDLEVSTRGLYSGALGYIKPSGDFDFNVIIRSLIYDSVTNYLSFHVGSAITSKSDVFKEYEECLLKAKAMISVLQ